jgi:CO/xanthine dehydrogenase Mo-binding subunit
VVLSKLQEQLLAREWELASREGAFITWEESLVAFACVIMEARVGHDFICAHTDAIRHHYLTQVSASSSQSVWRIALRRSMDERAAHLGLQETDLEVCDAALVEELEHGLCRIDGHDLPAELDEARARVRWGCRRPGRRGRSSVEATSTGGQSPHRLGAASS